MKALYFGTYDRAAPRNTQVISCLRAAGVDVVERHRQVWGRHNWSFGLGELARLARAEGALLRTPENQADIVIVGYPGHFDVPAARRVARGRPVVFNPLVSLHDTLVGDRTRFRPGSPTAGILRATDRRAFRGADVVVADTAAHAAFFQESFGLSEDRVEVAFVGAEDALFHPGHQPESPFHVLFVGKLIPLHGLHTILEAAKRLPDVPFRVVGDGQLASLLEDRPDNVEHVRWVEYEELPGEYQRAGCALGVFGAGPKAQRVIPNKAFQALACGAPLVTADTPAARELLEHQTDALLVPPEDPEALARAIAELAAAPVQAARLGQRGRETYDAKASEPVLGAQWREILERACALGR